MARIEYGEPGAHAVFDYLDDGAIVPLELDISGDEMVLRPRRPASQAAGDTGLSGDENYY